MTQIHRHLNISVEVLLANPKLINDGHEHKKNEENILLGCMSSREEEKKMCCDLTLVLHQACTKLQFLCT